MAKRRIIRIVARIDSDVLGGVARRWVSWDLPNHEFGNVTSINTILDCLGITPKDGECFELSVEPVAADAKGD